MGKLKKTSAKEAEGVGHATSTGQLLLDYAKPLFVAFVTAAGGIVAYVATPLNEFVNGWIWKEDADVLLIGPSTVVREGEAFAIDILVVPRSPVPISEGTLTLKYPAAQVRPTPETKLVLTTPKLTGPTRVTEKGMVFLAELEGKGKFEAEFKSRNGLTVTKSLDVQVEDVVKQKYATLANFSGDWYIDLGPSSGKMTLQDRQRSISGDYRLLTGEQGQLEGVRDGTSFRVTFYRGKKPSIWRIDGKFDPKNSSDIEIGGSATLLVADSTNEIGWKPYDTGKPYAFHAVSKRR